MKYLLFLAIFTILLIPTFGLAQTKSEPIMFDEFEKVCSEDLMARYDNFLVQLQNEPDAKGYIIFNGEKSQEGSNLLYANYVSKIYPRLRGFDTNRIILVRGENLDTVKTSFWVVPSGAKPPFPENIARTQKRSPITRFQKTYAEIFKNPDSGEEFVNGFYDLGCNFAPNLEDFAKELLKDENLTGYLIIYGNKKQSKKINKMATRILIKDHKVPKNRLKTIYGKQQEEPEIELWFVPQGEKAPANQ